MANMYSVFFADPSCRYVMNKPTAGLVLIDMVASIVLLYYHSNES